MASVYLIDADQLAVIQRVQHRLYDEMHRLTADERRDLANALEAVTHNIVTYGAADDLPDPRRG